MLSGVAYTSSMEGIPHVLDQAHVVHFIGESKLVNMYKVDTYPMMYE